MGEHVVGYGPRISCIGSSDDVKPDAEPQGASLLGGQRPHATQAFSHHVWRFPPGEIHVNMRGGNALSGRRSSAEVHGRHRIGNIAGRCPGDLVEVALKVKWLAAPRLAHDLQELARSGIASVLVEPVAEAIQLARLCSRHDVEQQSAAGEPLVGRSHLCGERGREKSGSERHQELDAARQRRQGDGGKPRVLAHRPARRQHSLVAELIAGSRDLGEVVHRWRPPMRARLVGEHVARVAASWQEPVDLHRPTTSLTLQCRTPRTTSAAPCRRRHRRIR